MLAIRIDWLTPAYEAADTPDTTTAEWPPHPIRPFCGMVAAARTDAEWAALRWLEAQAPPAVLAPVATRPDDVRRAWVPTNAVDAKDAHQRYPARVSGQAPRAWPRSFPAVPSAAFVWEEADPGPETVEALSRLCARVPYVGRATSPALVSVSTTGFDHDGLDEYRAIGLADTRVADASLVRVPYAGYVDRLRDAYDGNLPSWDVARTVLYGRVDAQAGQATPEPIDGPYGDVVVLGFGRRENGRRVVLDGAHAVAVTAAFRRAALARTNAVFPALHGHHDGNVVQCAYLAVPDVGHPHADGHLLGVALTLPRTLTPEERRVILRALIGEVPDDSLAGITAGPLGKLPVERDTGERRGLDVTRWTASSTLWASALPVVLDRFPKRGDDIADMVSDACDNAGLPRPAEVLADRAPFVTGGVSLRPGQTVRRRGEPRWLPYRHVLLRFERPVRGPVMVGSMRHFGLGLCLPLHPVTGEPLR